MSKVEQTKEPFQAIALDQVRRKNEKIFSFLDSELDVLISKIKAVRGEYTFWVAVASIGATFLISSCVDFAIIYIPDDSNEKYMGILKVAILFTLGASLLVCGVAGLLYSRGKTETPIQYIEEIKSKTDPGPSQDQYPLPFPTVVK
jgi:hypothetical protein